MKTPLITKMKIAGAVLTLCLCLALLRPAAQAEGDAVRGKQLAYTCLGCHGIDGYRNAYPSYRVPKLGGQKAAYIEAALLGYRSGDRRHTTMQAQASSLSEQEIRDLAAYFATLGDSVVEAGGEEVEGIELASTCVACHGENGIAVQPQWPTLAGQHASYLEHALKQYRSGDRRNAVMAQFAQNLSDADIRRLAEFYSGLAGLKTTDPT